MGNVHTQVIGPKHYLRIKKVYTNDSQKEKYKDKLAPWVKVLNNKRSKQTYSYLEQVTAEKIKQQQINNSRAKLSPELEFKIITDKQLAYVKIPSFRQQRRQADYKKLIKFWVRVKDYPHLIIDLRGNSGGSDFYWLKNIVEPLIRKPIKYKQLFCL